MLLNLELDELLDGLIECPLDFADTHNVALLSDRFLNSKASKEVTLCRSPPTSSTLVTRGVQ